MIPHLLAILLLFPLVLTAGEVAVFADQLQVMDGDFTEIGRDFQGFQAQMEGAGSVWRVGGFREDIRAQAFAGEDQQVGLRNSSRRVFLESVYATPHLTLGSSLQAGTRGLRAGTLSLGFRSFYSTWNAGGTARWDLYWQDPLLPDSIDVLRMGFQSHYSLLQVGWRGQLAGWEWNSSAGYGWTWAPEPDIGRSFRDSSVLGVFALETAFSGRNFRYTSRLHGLSGFSVLQGLRFSGSDTKRFAYARLGLDHWAWKHELKTGFWSFGLLGSWSFLRMHPTDHVRAGETLAANRLFDTDLLGILGHALYRKSYQAEGDAHLWLGGFQAGWKRGFRGGRWTPGWDWQLWVPYLTLQAEVAERTMALLYSHTRQESLDGEWLVLLGCLRGHLEWRWNASLSARLDVYQWLPWIVVADLQRRDSAEQPGAGNGEESQNVRDDENWQFGRDGLGLALSARVYF